MPSPETDLYFFHIQKTAGTSISSFLRTVYAEHERMDFIKPHQIGEEHRSFINQHRYFHGHIGNLLYPFLDRDVPTITFLRDPFEQSISRLRFMVKQNKNRRLFSFLVGCRLELYKPKYGSAIHRLLDRSYARTSQSNIQTNLLGVAPSPEFIAKDEINGVSWHADIARQRREKDAGTILADAKKRLDSMAVVGTVERFDESLGLVCEFLGVPRPGKSPAKRIAPGHAIGTSYRNDPTVPPALARIVERNIQLDIEIHRYATALLETQLATKSGKPRGKAA